MPGNGLEDATTETAVAPPGVVATVVLPPENVYVAVLLVTIAAVVVATGTVAGMVVVGGGDGGGGVNIAGAICEKNSIAPYDSTPHNALNPLTHPTMMLITPTAVTTPGRPPRGTEYSSGCCGTGAG
jgi:hypothetical protein